MTKQKPSQALKKALLEQFSFEDDASLAILETALQSYDLMDEARAQLAKDGLTCQGDRGGIKAHPCAAILRDAKAGFLAAMRALKLEIGGDVEPTRPVGRPSKQDLEKRAKRGQR